MDRQVLEGLRGRIEEVDRVIVTLLARRQALAKEIGQAKASLGIPIRDYATEKLVIDRISRACADEGLDQHWGEAVARRLIQGAVKTQEDLHGEIPTGPSRRVLIVGGLGQMGRWLCRFFANQGHPVVIHDPSPADGDYPRVPLSACQEAEIIVVATPLASSADVLREIIEHRPKGLVFDIASLKEPVRDLLKQAVGLGLRITSIHPMFGPGVQLLSGRSVFVCDCGHDQANGDVEQLFSETSLSVQHIDLDRHDELMGVVLGLSHALSIVGFSAFDRSGWSMDDLLGGASTTFSKLIRTIAEVARENPKLYYEIQKLNRHTPKMFELLEHAVRRAKEASLADDPKAFVALMEAGNDLFKDIDFSRFPANFTDPI